MNMSGKLINGCFIDDTDIEKLLRQHRDGLAGNITPLEPGQLMP